MKFKSLGIAATIVVTSLAFWGSSDAQETLITSYREPRHIVFMCMYGGSSNVNWVLSILDELSKRGHKITYITREMQSKYSNSYPHFNTIVLDGEQTHLESAFGLKRATILDAAGTVLRSGYKDFPSAAYAAFQDAGASYVNNNILTMKSPTTREMGFLKRFYDMFIIPVKAIVRMKPYSDWIISQRRLANCGIIEQEYDSWTHRNNLKIINTLFGMETARPVGPLIEFVGPIMEQKYKSLTVELKRYLESHTRVIYIAFGQHAVASEHDLRLILIGLLESIESGAYDGFLWAFRKGVEAFPSSVKTRSGNIYETENIFNGFYSNLKFVKWAPQTAVVVHPSVTTFLTHGGAVSMYEGLYAGKRLIVFPFYGDQFLNAHNTKYNGLGGYLSPELDQQQTTNIIADVGKDPDNYYQKNVNRYRALVQIHSQNGVYRGANLVEEVLFVNNDTQLPYRYEVSRQMSYVKSHNIDLICFALFVFMCSIRVSFELVKIPFRHSLVRKWLKISAFTFSVSKPKTD
ncbi:hypothetical protein BY458DRAFT_468743 [Sporodiniella umbellata]|nr:hypothetical protein BY458DRAFT_468743 [Sporodiniella umbellata]